MVSPASGCPARRDQASDVIISRRLFVRFGRHDVSRRKTDYAHTDKHHRDETTQQVRRKCMK